MLFSLGQPSCLLNLPFDIGKQDEIMRGVKILCQHSIYYENIK